MMRVETHNPNKPNLVRLVYEKSDVDMYIVSQQIDTNDVRETAMHLIEFGNILKSCCVSVPCGPITGLEPKRI